ncbi:MAG: DUF2179 domain-containing protein, partial [Bacteroidales bacterium]|nr:DUF2179 domain-containing protein [Bacteroidales bacterium]
GYGATSIEAHGAKEKVHLIYTIVQRHELGKVIEIIDTINPKAFYTIEDVRAVNEGIFIPRKKNKIFPFSNIIRDWRKGK